MLPAPVVLDACVLIPRRLCDILLDCVVEGLYILCLTDEIMKEVSNHYNVMYMTPDNAQKLVNAIRTIFSDSMLPYEKYSHLLGQMYHVQDEDDRHVLAAAVAAGAGYIVTDNVSDFPDHAFTDYGIEIYTADEFLLLLFEMYPSLMQQIVENHLHKFKDPPWSIYDLLRQLRKRTPNFVDRVLQELPAEPEEERFQ